MTKITASEVNRLRKMTGSGMMDCKKALVEAEGDFDKAVDLLRKRGQKVAAKRGDREASEGLVIAKSSEDGTKGVIFVLNCETDFVAKNEEFVKLATTIGDLALNNFPASTDDLNALPFEGATSIGDRVIEEVGKIGEKIFISGYERIDSSVVVAYNHPGNQVASLVGLSVAGDQVNEAGRDIAMQVAAMAPVALDKDQVSAELVEKEIEIGKDQARQEGKPEAMLEKIAMGKLNKFYKENTLLNQDFIKDTKKTVTQYLKEIDNDLTVTSFKRFSLS